eukprot:TRINITY_DN35321_c0_g2_i1.p1 TRINITY_DN35321_c0_g2~~TRINITY_DN35321_c0_g2_i1.p1  ORF type:complete len:201 (+),score=34.51 TRINITY_DN35321_c0_g2_i1:283-885(+)
MAEETVENLKQKQKEVPTIPRTFSRYGDGTTIEECQEMIAKSLRNPTVKFLREHLENAGCFVGEKFFKAVECDNHISGGYVPGQGILVCSNQMNIQDEVNQVVIHELIHAYDDCRAANLNWANCAHHACSEIRAGHLSGDCHYKRELLRGFMKIRGHEQMLSSMVPVIMRSASKFLVPCFLSSSLLESPLGNLYPYCKHA